MRPVPHSDPFSPAPDQQCLQAINKPPRISSAQVLRELQDYFRPSSLFASRLSWQLEQASTDAKRSSRKQRIAAEKVKIGHGGTLDPLATGVLVVGVGKGTKQLNSFLGCTKTYETVVLFGKDTDTYDVAGKIVASKPYQHVTRTMVEEKLASFRGNIRQVPPIYSALRIDGMKAYDYARTGKDLPRELEARDMEVEQCELVEWCEGGKHEYRWPATEASGEVKELAVKLTAAVHDDTEGAERSQKKRPAESVGEGDEERNKGLAKKQRIAHEVVKDDRNPHLRPVQGRSEGKDLSLEPFTTSTTFISKQLMTADQARLLHTHEIGPLALEMCPAPAARIRMTVSSGFYVRSFAHDLGIACGSLALMATLFRSRQAGFYAGSALAYEDLERGETVWGPKLEKMLQSWNEQQSEQPRFESGSRLGEPRVESGRVETAREQKTDMGNWDQAKRDDDRKRRNTSSGED